MRHQDLVINHRLESWVYANEAARLAATGFVAADVSRIAYQTDTGDYWRLTAPTPAWAPIYPVAPATVTLQTSPVITAGTTSATPVMAGLNATLTPVRSGKIFVTVSGSCYNDTAGGGFGAVMRHGTGGVPLHGVAAAGTPIGGTAFRSTGYGANQTAPLSLSAVITGLALGTAIWIDLSYNVTAGKGVLYQVAVAAFELP
jgi:hypothetical protein